MCVRTRRAEKQYQWNISFTDELWGESFWCRFLLKSAVTSERTVIKCSQLHCKKAQVVFFCLFVCFVLRERVCTTSQDKNLLICFEMLKPSWDCQKEQLQHLRCVLELMWFWTKPVGGLNIFGGLYLRFLSFKGQSAQTCTYVLRAAGVCVCVCVSVCVSAFYYVRKKRKQELDRERRWSGDQSVSDSAGECVCVCVCVCVCRGGVIEQIA